MTSISTRRRYIGLMTEVTENTPLLPTSTAAFIPASPAFTMEPGFDNLENDELRGTIGKAKSRRGSENPKVADTLNLRHSGVEGQAPQLGPLCKAAFGAEVVDGTERSTTSGSTETVLKVPAGHGASKERGEVQLIKDSTNAYRIRALHGVSTDDLTLGFALPTGKAPDTGIALGKCVLYKPADDSHASLCFSDFLGNGGLKQVTAGARISELSWDITAGQIIKMAYQAEGAWYGFNPIEITSATRYLDFEDDNGVVAAVVTAGWYKDPHELAAALQTAMRAVSAATALVTYSNSTGKFTVKTSGTLLTLMFATGANTANTIATKIGFTVADESGTAATTGYTSDSAITLSSPYTPAFDSADPLVAKNNEVLIGDQSDYACFAASKVQVTLSDAIERKPSICAESGFSGSIVSEREVTVNVTAFIDQYDADKFSRYRQSTETRFQFSFGEKVGGNWVAGKCGAFYGPTMTVESFKIGDQSGRAILEMTLKCFVNTSSEGEFYLGFV